MPGTFQDNWEVTRGLAPPLKWSTLRNGALWVFTLGSLLEGWDTEETRLLSLLAAVYLPPARGDRKQQQNQLGMNINSLTLLSAGVTKWKVRQTATRSLPPCCHTALLCPCHPAVHHLIRPLAVPVT